MEQNVSVNIRQAVALLGVRLGWRVWSKEVERLSRTLISIGQMAERDREEGGWEFTSDEVDLLAGELLRRRMPWRRKVLHDRGFRARVIGADGSEETVLLPWYTEGGVWGAVDESRRPESVECREWPTGRRTGVLVATGAVSGGLPLYRWIDPSAGKVETIRHEEGYDEIRYVPEGADRLRA